jgi:hypothetical protein
VAVGPGIAPGPASQETLGLQALPDYRRSGISPCPEGDVFSSGKLQHAAAQIIDPLSRAVNILFLLGSTLLHNHASAISSNPFATA